MLGFKARYKSCMFCGLVQITKKLHSKTKEKHQQNTKPAVYLKSDEHGCQ